MQKHLLLISFFVMCLFSEAYTQSYLTAAGVRVGGGVGMSLEQKVIENTTIEGVLAQQSIKSMESPRTFSAMIKRHHNIKGRALNGYWGLGGHQAWDVAKDKSYGFDGVVGIETTIFYLNTAVDYRPSVTMENSSLADLKGQLSVSIRYVIFQAPHAKKIKKQKNQKGYSLPPYKPTWT